MTRARVLPYKPWHTLQMAFEYNVPLPDGRIVTRRELSGRDGVHIIRFDGVTARNDDWSEEYDIATGKLVGAWSEPDPETHVLHGMEGCIEYPTGDCHVDAPSSLIRTFIPGLTYTMADGSVHHDYIETTSFDDLYPHVFGGDVMSGGFTMKPEYEAWTDDDQCAEEWVGHSEADVRRMFDIPSTHTPPPCQAVAMTDDDLYGKATRDESGAPIREPARPPRTDRVNQDLQWFKDVNRLQREKGLNGDEPYPEPEPVKATGGFLEPRAYICGVGEVTVPRAGNVDAPGWDFDASRDWLFYIGHTQHDEVVAYDIDCGWVDVFARDLSLMAGRKQTRRHYGRVEVYSKSSGRRLA